MVLKSAILSLKNVYNAISEIVTSMVHHKANVKNAYVIVSVAVNM